MIKLNTSDFDKRIGANIADASGGVLFQAENKIQIPSDRHSIVIGVGGSGCNTIEDVKRLMQSKFVDWQNRVAFLAIDADNIELENRKVLSKSEKHGLVCEPGANQRWHNEGKRLEKVKKWIHRDFQADVQDPNGAGRIRQAARARLYDWGNHSNPNDNKLKNKINGIFNDLTQGSLDKEVQVYIVLGLAGGTGSGLLIDIADLVYRAAPDGVPCRITGFFYLPDTVEEFFRDDTATMASMRANGYAALKELDYYVSLLQRGMDYPEASDANEPNEKAKYVGLTKPLYSMVFLISGRGTESNQTARKAVMESLSNLIAEVKSDDGDAAHQFLSKSFLTNKGSARDSTIASLSEVEGVYLEDTYDYCSIGVGIASIPEGTIKSYAIGQLAHMFFTGETPWREIPLDDHAANLEIDKMVMTDPNELSRKIREVCNRLVWPPDTLAPTAKEILAGSKDAEQTQLLRLNDAQQNASNEMALFLENKYHQFRNAAEVFLKKHGPDCLIHMWKGTLPGGGVYPNGGMSVRLEEIFNWSSNVNVTLAQQKLQAAKNNCRGVLGFIPVPKAPEVWRDTFKALHTERIAEKISQQVFGNEARTHGMLLEKYIIPIKTFMGQIESFGQILRKMQNVYGYLGSPFSNFQQFKDVDGDTAINYNILGDNSAYNWAKNILDRTITHSKALDLRNALVESFMGNSMLWTKEMGETASDFMPARLLYDEAVSRIVHFESDLSLEAYMRYVKHSGNEIEDVSSRIINETVNKAASLFVRAEGELRNNTSYTYILIPNSFMGAEDGSEIYNAFQHAARNQVSQNLRIFPSPITGRIVCYRVACALPLYSLAGLPVWENAYDLSSRVWIHANESDAGYFNRETGLRWEDYPALALGRHPYPKLNVVPSTREGRFMKNILLDTFDKAEKNGILRLKKSENSYFSYEFQNLSKLGFSDDYVLDLDGGYDHVDDSGFFMKGQVLVDYLVQGRSTPVDVKLHGTDRLTLGQTDAKNARFRAERVLRRHVPMFIEVRNSLRQVEKLSKQIDLANQKTLVDILHQFVAELVAYDFIQKEGDKNPTWTLHGYPSRGNKQQIIRMNALAMKSKEEKHLFNSGWLYLILVGKFEEAFSKHNWEDISQFRHKVMEIQGAIAEGEIPAKPNKERLASFNKEAKMFISEYGENVPLQRSVREKFTANLGIQSHEQQNAFWEKSIKIYEYVIELHKGLEQISE